MMARELRNTGISAVGDVPWGTHFCHFYDTKEDLLDILIPYFKTGLENNEFCFWVVSDPLAEEEARNALREALPEADRYLAAGHIEIVPQTDLHQQTPAAGRIEIVPDTEWYLESGAFNAERVIAGWNEKVAEALAKGYAGLRANGSGAWLTEENRKDFIRYEQTIDEQLSDQPIIVLCSYPLSSSSAAEIFDVVKTHQLGVLRRRGNWEVIETPEPLLAKAEIKRLDKELRQVLDRTTEPAILRYGVAVLSVIAAVIIARGMETNLHSASHVSLFLCAVMFSAWFGGVRPGLLSIVLSVLAFDYFFVPPIYSFALATNEIPRLLMFALSALFVGCLSAAQRTKAESLRQARDVLGGTVQQLKQTNEALRRENAERRRAEALLHVREQEFRAIVENAPDHIARYDRSFRRTYVNPAFAKAFGLPAEVLIGKPMLSSLRDAGANVQQDELVQIRQRCEDVFDTGKSCEFEVTVPMPTGRRYFSVRFFPELDLNGSVINVLGIARDVTERKVAEEELKKEKEVLRKIFDNIPVMIGFVGKDDRVKLVNPEWERTMGWTLKELQEEDVDIFTEAYPDLSYRQEVLDFVAAATGQWVDLNIRVRDGRVIDAACAVVHLSDGTKVAIAQDITERKQAEEKLKATTEQLRALSASLRSAREEEGIRIARELHDELGAGLSSLKWDLEEVFEVVSQSTAPPHIAGLRKRIEAMIELTDTTVNAVRRITSELRPTALDELGLSEAIEWQARQFQERTGIIVQCDCDQEGVALSAERSTALFRIFQEALTNILRHAQATKVHIQLNIEHDEFILTIADDGRGITDDEKSGQRTLGLLGMRERAHLVGGKVDITGSDGKGTLVTVRIPISAKTYSEASH